MRIIAACLTLVLAALFPETILIAQEDSVDHTPRFVLGNGCYLGMQCVMATETYEDSVWLADPDLARLDSTEYVELRVEPSGFGFSITPAIITGPLPNDTVKLYISTSFVPATPGPFQIKLVARDRNGLSDTLRYVISISDQPVFSMPITIRNSSSRSASQTLIFGLGREGTATTGFEKSARGQLDSNYCEYELPPPPPAEVFDARWVIPGTLGTLRNIYPIEGNDIDPIVPPWFGRADAGRTIQSGLNHPVAISWSKEDARRASEPLYISDTSGLLYVVNMQNGAATTGTGVQVVLTADSVTLLINLDYLTDFKITQGFLYDLPLPDPMLGYRLQCTPLPSHGDVDITYTLPKAGDLLIEIFDLRGESVRLLADEIAEAGGDTIVWDGKDESGNQLPNGTYYCRMTTKDGMIGRTIILAR